MTEPDPTRPLEGFRVLEIGAFVAGPYAASLMGSLGAEVVKVEPPRGGDAFRRGEGAANPWFVQLNAGKRSLAVNLKAPEGVALVKALLPRFDVVLENSRPGKMAALGLGVEDIHRVNPDIVHASVSGFGDGGPWRDRAAYDTIGLSMSGFLSIMSDSGRPQLAGTCIGDLATALVTTVGILAGLAGRGRGGRRGADIRTSLLESMSTLTIDAVTQMFETGAAPRRESRHPSAQSFCLTCADGRAVTVHLSSSDKFWRGFLNAMGREDLAADPRFTGYAARIRHYFDLRPIVEAEFARATRAEWEARLIACDVPFAPLVTAEELPGQPQTAWLEQFETGPDGRTLVRPPWRFDGRRAHRQDRTPQVGEHTREVAGEVLPAAEVERLIAAGVLEATEGAA